MSGYTEIELRKFVADDIKKYKDIAMPVKPGYYEKHFLHKIDPRKLHPNPDDEFCDPNVGPSFAIINNYMSEFAQANKRDASAVKKPLMVEKMYPDGYMLVNGHHRWAAAMRLGLETVPIKLVTLTPRDEMNKMMRNTRHDKWAYFDLEDVILCPDDSVPAEKSLPFPGNILHRGRIRAGIPSLTQSLENEGYDIWVFSDGVHPVRRDQTLLKKYNIPAIGVISTKKPKGKLRSNMKEKQKLFFQDIFNKKYKESLFVSRDSISRRKTGAEEYDVIPLEAADEEWPSIVIREVRKFDL